MPVLRYLETCFRNRWLITIPAMILLFSSLALIATIEPTYEVSSRIWTDRSDYLQMPGDNPYLTPAQVQASRFRELISTKSFTSAIVERTAVGATGDGAEKRGLIAMIQRELQIYDTGEHSIFLGFKHENPQLALDIMTIAVDEFNGISLQSSQSQAEAALAFYRERVAQYEATILPRSNAAVLTYLEDHPEVRRNLQENGPPDPQLTMLQQQAERDRLQYDEYRRSLDAIALQSEAARQHQEHAFRFIDAPAVDKGGALGKKTILLYAGIGVGLSAGYIILFLLLATELDVSLRNASDVRRRLHLPVLDVIPDYTERRRRSFRLFRPRQHRSSSSFWARHKDGQAPFASRESAIES